MKTLHNIVHYLNTGLKYFLIVCMSLMIFTVTWQVFTRFVLQNPSVFTDELSRYFLVWIGILGGAYTFGLKRHLALELLITTMNDKNKEKLNIAIY